MTDFVSGQCIVLGHDFCVMGGEPPWRYGGGNPHTHVFGGWYGGTPPHNNPLQDDSIHTPDPRPHPWGGLRDLPCICEGAAAPSRSLELRPAIYRQYGLPAQLGANF